MPLRTFEDEQPCWIRADQVKEGQWIIDSQNARFDRRIVDVGTARADNDYKIRIRHDYGNGGEPATSFYRPLDVLLVTDQKPL